MADKSNQDKPTSDGEAGETPKRKTRTTGTSRTRKGTGEATPKSTAGKAKSAAKKVAAVVSDTVKEIAEKVTKKATRPTVRKSSAKATPADESDVPVKKTVRRAPTNRTKTAALAEGTTTADVRETILDLANSEDVPAESNPEAEAPTDVREHFQHQGPPPPQPPRDLPDEYGDTKIVLLVRDPEWVYAYWEINDDTRAQVNFPRNGNGNGRDAKRKVLRIYKITDTAWPVDAAHYFFDVEVPSDARNWYIHLPEADQQWCAELGLIDNQENFISICRSNVVTTPRNTISDRIDSDWMTVEESFEKITRFSRESLQSQLSGASGTSSEAILRTINRQLTAVLHGEKVALSSGIFSSESGIPGASKDFWLQVHTELILYGATEPDAKVTVQGRAVELNADGTFSMRFALPDGLQILEVRAVNKDGDMEEQITPVVERTTR